MAEFKKDTHDCESGSYSSETETLRGSRLALRTSIVVISMVELSHGFFPLEQFSDCIQIRLGSKVA